MVAHTRGRVLDRLAGRYGCKRFLRDGHQTTVEDEHRLHYLAGELLKFANIESEWPLFFTYLLVDAEMTGDHRGGETWADRLEPLFQIRDGLPLLPELYFVDANLVEAEASQPGSQERVANTNLPLLWAQSQWALGAMLKEGLLEPQDIDPLGRRHHLDRRAQPEIAFSIVAQDEHTAKILALHGFRVETMAEVQSHAMGRPAGDSVSVRLQVSRLCFHQLSSMRMITISAMMLPRGHVGCAGICAIWRATGEGVIILSSFYAWMQLQLVEPA